VKILGQAVEVPPGYYFIGDPWYAVPMSQWVPLQEITGFWRIPVGTIGGHSVLAWHTADGRGIYFDQEHGRYESYSGLLGVTPVAMSAGGPEMFRSRGRLVTLPVSFTCLNDGAGRLQFGPYRINTREDR
jgi:hypothetical protein